MEDTKILQAILGGLTQVREDLAKFKKEVVSRFDKLDQRVDNLGMQIASLEDDAPTRDEFEDLEEKFGKFEKRFVSL